jgi:hypothetical protein
VDIYLLLHHKMTIDRYTTTMPVNADSCDEQKVIIDQQQTSSPTVVIVQPDQLATTDKPDDLNGNNTSKCWCILINFLYISIFNLFFLFQYSLSSMTTAVAAQPDNNSNNQHPPPTKHLCLHHYHGTYSDVYRHGLVCVPLPPANGTNRVSVL